jgi:hypothetical protein
MATRRVKTSLKLSEVIRITRDFPAIIAGKKHDIRGIRKAYWSGFANSMFHDIQVAFDQKANLETDELGDSWPDLAPSTKAYSRPARQGDLTDQEKRNLKNYRTKGLLDAQQTRIWRGFFNKQRIKLMREGSPPNIATNVAAVQAWAFIKSQGGVTKMDRLGFRKLQVLKDFKRLYKSLSQGTFNGYEYKPPNNMQIFQITREGCTLGTRDKKATFHHRGIPGKLPQRRLWPENISVWTARASIAGNQAAIEQLVRTIG